MNDLFDKDVLKRIGSSLIARSETIAVAESVTAGLLQFAFSNIPDASHFFEGGLTAYNLKQKSNQLRIEPLEAIQVNSISQHVADEMALHVSTKFITRWGIGVTGYASRVPENNPDLFAFYAIVYSGEIIARGKMICSLDDPPQAQLFYVNHIIDVLAKILSSER